MHTLFPFLSLSLFSCPLLVLQAACSGDIHGVEMVLDEEGQVPEEIKALFCHPLCSCRKCTAILRDLQFQSCSVTLNMISLSLSLFHSHDSSTSRVGACILPGLNANREMQPALCASLMG